MIRDNYTTKQEKIYIDGMGRGVWRPKDWRFPQRDKIGYRKKLLTMRLTSMKKRVNWGSIDLEEIKLYVIEKLKELK